MARRLTATLTMLAMLVHALLGCCLHHAHAEMCRPVDASCDHIESSECGHHHDDATSEYSSRLDVVEGADCCGLPEHGELPHNLCDEGPCQFVKNSVRQAPRPDDSGTTVYGIHSIADCGLAQPFSEAALLQVDDVPAGHCCAKLCAPCVTQVWRL